MAVLCLSKIFVAAYDIGSVSLAVVAAAAAAAVAAAAAGDAAVAASVIVSAIATSVNANLQCCCWFPR